MSRPTRREFLASSLPLGLPTFARTPDDLPVTGLDNPALAPFDELLTKFVKDHAIPGAAVAVTRNGKLMYARGFGYADTENKKAVRPDSLFRLASISKPITAVGV